MLVDAMAFAVAMFSHGGFAHGGELTPLQAADRVRSLATEMQGHGFAMDAPFRLRIASAIVELNSIPQSAFARVGDVLADIQRREAKERGSLVEWNPEAMVVLRLWFLLRYRHPRPDRLTPSEFTALHGMVVPRDEDRQYQKCYDFPWVRKGGKWSLRPFSIREPFVGTFRTMLMEFRTLPRR